MKNFTGKKAAVIGATGGLGRAVSTALSIKGCSLVLIGRDTKKLIQLQEEIKNLTGNTVYLQTVGRFDQYSEWEKTAAETENSFGIPDFIINTAGTDVRKKLSLQTEEEISSQIDINLKGSIFITKAFLPLLQKKGQGEILHFSGFLDGRLAFPYYSADAASRAGLVTFVESVNREIGSSLIRAAVYCPSAADTEAERPFHPIWKEMGLKIASSQETAEECLEMLGSEKTLRISGGFLNRFFARLNSAFPKFADLIIMNKYSKILKKHLDSENESDSKEETSPKSPFLLYAGISMIVLSFVLYALIPAVPFFPISTEAKGAGVTGLILSGEISFWVGLVIAGKPAYESMKNRLKSLMKQIFGKKVS